MSNREEASKSVFPFNSYDVFGYLIPGAVFFLATFIFDYWGKIHLGLKHKPMHSLILIFWNGEDDASSKELSTFSAIVTLIVSIIVVYIIGHAIAAISSFYIDRVLVKKAHGYPIKNILLMNIHSDERNNRDEEKKSIKANFLLFNISIILIYLSGAVYAFMAVQAIFNSSLYFHMVFGALAIISVVSFILSFSYSKTLFLSNRLSSSYDKIALRLKAVIGSEKEISSQTVFFFKKFMKKHLGLKKSSTSTDVYWLAFIFISKKSSSANRLLSNWLQLYSFARNLSASFYLAFIYGIFLIMVNVHTFQSEEFIGLGRFKVLIGLAIPLFYWGIAILFLLRFFYLYTSYYSKFLVRACASYYVENK